MLVSHFNIEGFSFCQRVGTSTARLVSRQDDLTFAFVDFQARIVAGWKMIFAAGPLLIIGRWAVIFPAGASETAFAGMATAISGFSIKQPIHDISRTTQQKREKNS